MLKCSRCRHVFPAPFSKKPPAARPPAQPKPAAPAHENLKLPFDDSAWKDDAQAFHSDDFTLLEPEERFTLGTEEPPGEPAVPTFAAEPPPAPRPTPAKRQAVKEAPDEDDTDEEAEPMSEREQRARERGKVRALLVILTMVVAGYAALARTFFASPAWSDRLLSRVPLIGMLGYDRLMIRKVALSDVAGNYQRIKDGKEVFVITGKALNTAPVALHAVQIAAKLYNRSGRELDQKTIFCGNVISVKVLKDLTPRELSVLQKLNPPRRFMIEPGGASTFVIVFMDPPADAVEFTTKVVAAQRQT
jgi:hypothetical protein